MVEKIITISFFFRKREEKKEIRIHEMGSFL